MLSETLVCALTSSGKIINSNKVRGAVIRLMSGWFDRLQIYAIHPSYYYLINNEYEYRYHSESAHTF